MNQNIEIISNNRKAFHSYTIIEKYEAGLILLGSEVKSLREKKLNLRESFIALVTFGSRRLFTTIVAPSIPMYFAAEKPIPSIQPIATTISPLNPLSGIFQLFFSFDSISFSFTIFCCQYDEITYVCTCLCI